MMTQAKMDRLIIQAKRRHKNKMEKLNEEFLGKRADVARDELGTKVPLDDLAEEAYGI